MTRITRIRSSHLLSVSSVSSVVSFGMSAFLMSVPDPVPSPALPGVQLKIQRRSSHPWIFQKMVEKPTARLPPGGVVDILDKDRTWVGRGFYNGHSRIALRVLTANRDEAIDAEFSARRLARAVALRRDWLKLDAVSDAYRL